MSKDLKPCPFCGCEVEIKTTKWQHSGEIRSYKGKCKNCKFQTATHIILKKIIELCNSRAETWGE